ncbi:RNA polymerase sigma factor [Kutzneria chonburiensis]|uniref:RNA polymerase sigma factor n=1 Tax=Kutzneria chonburiensis TaxID=1483604 RepID=A0ABV6MSW3_9PSEU|nr:sigma-70 family RNA polymerase sigma factor [Kutzneria chonburiensis]
MSRPDFDAFYRKTVESTLRAALRVSRDRHVALDATQDAYVVMLERWDLHAMRSLDANHRYVIGIAVKKVATWYRAQSRFEPAELDHGGDEPGYDRILDDLAVLSRVRALIDRQPRRRREVAALRFLAGWTYREIARWLDMNESTVGSHTKEMVDQLRPLITELTNTTKRGEPS